MRAGAIMSLTLLTESTWAGPGPAGTTATSSTQGSSVSGQNYVETDGGLNLHMVWIPGGTFTIGSPASEEGREENEGPQHQVTLDGFWLGKYEVTQGQYERAIGSNPSQYLGADKPVETVSWNDAVSFCRKLSETSGRVYKLPTEAQWEYACRAGTTTPFYFGDTISTDKANYNGNFIYGRGVQGVESEGPRPVGNFTANPFGLYDMHGNVREWCADVFDADYYGKSPKRNPECTAAGTKSTRRGGLPRVLRGGSWVDWPSDLRSALRWREGSADVGGNDGFRVCRVAGVR